MEYSARLGLLAATLAIGGGLATTGAATAHAAPERQHPGPNVAVSLSGVGFNSGSAKANSTFGSAAIAIGANSKASATNGVLNRAVAIGQNNTVTVTNGNFNRAVAIGNGNIVTVANGDHNSAYVRGNGNATVFVGGGNNNRATIIGDQNTALAGCFGTAGPNGLCPADVDKNTPRRADDNVVVVKGDRNGVTAGSAADLFPTPVLQRGNRAIVTGDDNAGVLAGVGSDNTAIVQGSRNGGVIAGLGNDNTAIVRVDDHPDMVSAGGFDNHVPPDGNVVIVDENGGS